VTRWLSVRYICNLDVEKTMGSAAPSPDEVDEAARRAAEEALLKPSLALTADYVDLLAKKGYLLKKRSGGQDIYKPSRKFGIAWADATLTAMAKVDPDLFEEDPLGAIALEMTFKVLGLDGSNIAKGRNPEEFARLAGVIVGIARAYFGPEYIGLVRAAMKDEMARKGFPGG
jgi:hypothetical protein